MTRPTARTLPEQGEDGMQQPKKRLTTSAMIASLAGPGQRTKPAPFGHALVAEAANGRRSSVSRRISASTPIWTCSPKPIRIASTRWAWPSSC